MGSREWRQQDFDRLAALSAADFDSLVGAEASLADDPGVVLEIVAVERTAGERPFDVVLRSTTDFDLPQGMHAIDLPGTGVVPLFLVPTGPVGDGHCYIASFG